MFHPPWHGDDTLLTETAVTEDPLHLAKLAADGDARALERLLEQHLPAVRAFVRAHMSPKLRARESASDLVQSVCRELLTHQDRFQHPGEHGFQAWLFTTARRKVANRARDLDRQRRDAKRELGDLRESAIAELGVAYSRISSPSGKALRREEVEQLEAAIDQLPDEQREVVTLAHLVGLSRAEIGVRMGKTEEAVRALLHRAKARLAILLGDPADG
ncbi:MAG: sigma-70 family RNA polymerase sigma factor [Planctomycetota bacterium]